MSEPFWKILETHGDAVALVPENGAPVSYVELAREADAFAAQLPAEPQLIALEAGNAVAPIAAYLGCLRAGHPVILLNEEALAEGRILTAYQPNWIYRRQGDDWTLQRFSSQPAALYSELAVLLSTSGTTGAPKLVRLSQDNVNSNAGAIAEYLGIDPSDRAITTLDFAYSFGMAALNAQFAAGAAVVLTGQPIVNEAFWERFEAAGTTSLSLVPYHFELLERVDFAGRALPSLRRLCQAGGRLAPDLVQKYEKLSRARGFKFFVMYGQTEASPRIAYVPPEHLAANPDCIGRAIPGGALLLRDKDGRDIVKENTPGELIYLGPNVMLGYAETREDLAKGRETEELATGDVAVRTRDGFFKIVGRLSRFVKIYGLRINLDEVEGQARAAGFSIYCSGDDETLALFHTAPFDQEALRDWVSGRYGLRRDDVLVEQVQAMPLLPSGKIDYAALKARVRKPKLARGKRAASVTQAFQTVFSDRALGPRDSFVSLGGDSLAYVSLMLDLEKILGHVPRDWERMEIGALERVKPQTGFFSAIPMEALVRVAAITTIITEHLHVLPIYGGAWALMMLVGYTAAKFSQDRLKAGHAWSVLVRTLGRVLLLYYAIMLLYFLTQRSHAGADPEAWLFLYANFTPLQTYLIVYWFVCAYAQVMLLTCAAWAIPPLRRWFSGNAQRFGYSVLALGLVAAYLSFPMFDGPPVDKNLLTILPIFALGWCVGAARSTRAKCFASLAAALVCGFFAYFSFVEVRLAPYFQWLDGSTLTYLFISSQLVIWIERVRLPKFIAKAVVAIAAASFFVYMLHLAPMHVLNAMGDPQRLDAIVAKWAIGLGAAFVLGLIAKAVLDWLTPKAQFLARRVWLAGGGAAGVNR